MTPSAHHPRHREVDARRVAARSGAIAYARPVLLVKCTRWRHPRAARQAARRLTRAGTEIRLGLRVCKLFAARQERQRRSGREGPHADKDTAPWSAATDEARAYPVLSIEDCGCSVGWGWTADSSEAAGSTRVDSVGSLSISAIAEETTFHKCGYALNWPVTIEIRIENSLTLAGSPGANAQVRWPGCAEPGAGVTRRLCGANSDSDRASLGTLRRATSQIRPAARYNSARLGNLQIVSQRHSGPNSQLDGAACGQRYAAEARARVLSGARR
jgi:hypothetical protein